MTAEASTAAASAASSPGAPSGNGHHKPTLDEAKAILQRYRIEKLPLVDDDGRLAGLITVTGFLAAFILSKVGG